MSSLLAVVLFCLTVLLFGTGKTHGVVLLWETQKAEVKNSFGGMGKVSSAEFRQYIENKFSSEHTPLIVVFVEKSLSVEDFSWRDSNGKSNFQNLKNVAESAESMEFIPNVEDALLGLEQLKSLGRPTYEVKDEILNQTFKCGDLIIVNYTEETDRTDSLRERDKKYSELFINISAECNHTIGILLGITEPSRSSMVKQVASSISPQYLIYQDPKGLGLMITKTYPKLTRNGKTLLLGEKNTHVSVTGDYRDSLQISLNINFGEYNLKVNFDNTTSGYWYLRSIDITIPKESQVLRVMPVEEIYAPLGMSFYSSYPMQFKDWKGTILTFGSLQVQSFFLNPGSKAFGDAVYAVPFFTAAILSGLFVMFILGSIFTWGVCMIMDIRTMTRFENPDGKGLVITSYDKD